LQNRPDFFRVPELWDRMFLAPADKKTSGRCQATHSFDQSGAASFGFSTSLGGQLKYFKDRAAGSGAKMHARAACSWENWRIASKNSSPFDVADSARRSRKHKVDFVFADRDEVLISFVNVGMNLKWSWPDNRRGGESGEHPAELIEVGHRGAATP